MKKNPIYILPIEIQAEMLLNKKTRLFWLENLANDYLEVSSILSPTVLDLVINLKKEDLSSDERLYKEMIICQAITTTLGSHPNAPLNGSRKYITSLWDEWLTNKYYKRPSNTISNLSRYSEVLETIQNGKKLTDIPWSTKLYIAKVINPEYKNSFIDTASKDIKNLKEFSNDDILDFIEWNKYLFENNIKPKNLIKKINNLIYKDDLAADNYNHLITKISFFEKNDFISLTSDEIETLIYKSLDSKNISKDVIANLQKINIILKDSFWNRLDFYNVKDNSIFQNLAVSQLKLIVNKKDYVEGIDKILPYLPETQEVQHLISKSFVSIDELIKYPHLISEEYAGGISVSLMDTDFSVSTTTFKKLYSYYWSHSNDIQKQNILNLINSNEFEPKQQLMDISNAFWKEKNINFDSILSTSRSLNLDDPLEISNFFKDEKVSLEYNDFNMARL